MEPIFVWWIGEDEPGEALMAHVRGHLGRAFERPAVLWSSPARPATGYDARRRQHQTAPILQWLLEAGPPEGKLLGLTDRDLFIPILTYVFGEAQLGGRAALCSTARLAEGVALIGPRLLQERLAKEAVHEVGHAFGLHHCDSPRCVMGRSAGLAGVDGKSHELCGTCRQRLRQPPAARRLHGE
jgi:archaemetzincin